MSNYKHQIRLCDCAFQDACTPKRCMCAVCVPFLLMWRYMPSTSAVSWGVGFLAAAAIQRRPLWDVYQVRPSTLHTKAHKQQSYTCFHLPDRNQESLIFVFVHSHYSFIYLKAHYWDYLFLTSWCLWPAVRPMADACWGTNPHQPSPAALCLVAAT